jgi:hypothetical protein
MRALSLFLFALVLPVLSSPIPWTNSPKIPDFSATNSGNTYSGAGGSAKGGSIKSPEHAGVLGSLGGGGSLLDAFSSTHIFAYPPGNMTDG